MLSFFMLEFRLRYFWHYKRTITAHFFPLFSLYFCIFH